jgi:DNA modification methylase
MSVRLFTGDCRTVLATLPDASVQCCVTSPPYFGLRDYGTASWEGGDAGCDHLMPVEATAGGRVGDNGRDRAASGGTFHGGPSEQKRHHYRERCPCGATRIDQQIGLEPTVAAYVAELVAVFRDVRRILRDDGVLFLNLGDSYATSPTGSYGTKSALNGAQTSEKYKQTIREVYTKKADTVKSSGLKPKDLIGVPWRVAFALQADGWYLRSDIIWSKLNPMPESVRDRPTKSHEMIFLLTKSPRYFWDAEAVREGVGESAIVVASDLQDERLILGQDFGSEEAAAQRAHVPVSPLHHDRHILQVGIRLASAILDRSQGKDEFGLSALDAEVWQERGGNGTSAGSVGVPVMRRATAQATRFADGDISPKEFLREIDRLCVALPDGDDLKELCIVAGLAATPAIELINADGNGTVRVNDASEIGQLQLIHNEKYTSQDTRSSEKRIKTKVPGGWDTAPGSHNTIHRTGRTEAEYVETELRGGRNIRSVWTIATAPFAEAHFATFPPALAERCIKAGTSEKGCCGACGAPLVRVTENESTTRQTFAGSNGQQEHPPGVSHTLVPIRRETTGWQPSCTCGADVKPCVVLDCFGGAGTVSLVSERLGRDSIYIDLSPTYAEMARKRIYNDAPLFAAVDLS